MWCVYWSVSIFQLSVFVALWFPRSCVEYWPEDRLVLCHISWFIYKRVAQILSALISFLRPFNDGVDNWFGMWLALFVGPWSEFRSKLFVGHFWNVDVRNISKQLFALRYQRLIIESLLLFWCPMRLLKKIKLGSKHVTVPRDRHIEDFSFFGKWHFTSQVSSVQEYMCGAYGLPRFSSYR